MEKISVATLTKAEADIYIPCNISRFGLHPAILCIAGRRKMHVVMSVGPGPQPTLVRRAANDRSQPKLTSAFRRSGRKRKFAASAKRRVEVQGIGLSQPRQKYK